MWFQSWQFSNSAFRFPRSAFPNLPLPSAFIWSIIGVSLACPTYQPRLLLCPASVCYLRGFASLPG